MPVLLRESVIVTVYVCEPAVLSRSDVLFDVVLVVVSDAFRLLPLNAYLEIVAPVLAAPLDAVILTFDIPFRYRLPKPETAVAVTLPMDGFHVDGTTIETVFADAVPRLEVPFIVSPVTLRLIAEPLGMLAAQDSGIVFDDDVPCPVNVSV